MAAVEGIQHDQVPGGGGTYGGSVGIDRGQRLNPRMCNHQAPGNLPIRPEGDRLPQVGLGLDVELGWQRRRERDQIGGHVAPRRFAEPMRRPVARSTRRSYSHGANTRTTPGPSSPITTSPLSSSA